MEIPPGKPREHTFGLVTFLGRTNVGKSSIINRLLGQKLAIVSSKPQTTRRRIRGILTLPESQMILVDTPGLHQGQKPVNLSLQREARQEVAGADLILAVTDPVGTNHKVEEDILREIVRHSGRPALLAVNKIDLVRRRKLSLMLEHLGEERVFRGVLGISARSGKNFPELMRSMSCFLSPGPPQYPRDIVSDQPERDFFAEIVREKIFHYTHQELPYSAAVVVDEVREERGHGTYRIQATVYVERESQKGILIGRGGSGLRRIGEAARREIEEFTGSRVFIGLWVKVRRDWTRNGKSLREFGFA